MFVPADEKFEGYFEETASAKALKDAVSPEVNIAMYYMITGEGGIGKSSAAKHCADVLGHKGIVYVKVPESGDPNEFEHSLARRLHLYHLIYDKFVSYITVFSAAILLDFPSYDGDKKSSCLSIIMNKLSVLSRQYKRWHNDKGIVVVIDQVNHFLKQEKGMKYLEELQDIAKTMADNREIKFVFISSDDEAFGKMMKRSANSRANIQEFKEATDNESYAFLRKRVGEAKFHVHQNELANLIDKYAGGKFLLLNSINGKIDDLEGVKDDFRKQASVALETIRMHMPKDKITKNVSTDPSVKKTLVMLDIGHDILNHGMIARGEVVMKITGIMEEEEFRRSNIFAYHWAHNSYTFATRALQTMFEEAQARQTEEETKAQHKPQSPMRIAGSHQDL